MRIRNTGESLSRPFPRLQRTRRCRGRTAHSDVKRRTSTCSQSPYRAASGLPTLLPAATPVSNAPTCRRWPPYYIHRHRDTIGTISTPSVAPSLHVPTTTSVLLRRRRVPSAISAANRWSQAQSPRRLALGSSPDSGAAAQPIRSGDGKRLTTAFQSGLFHTTVPPTASPAIFSTSHPPPHSSSTPQ